MRDSIFVARLAREQICEDVAMLNM